MLWARRGLSCSRTLRRYTEFAQGGGGGGASQAGPNHEDLVLALVRGIHQLHVEAVLVPRLFDGSCRCFPSRITLFPPLFGQDAGENEHGNGAVATRKRRRELSPARRTAAWSCRCSARPSGRCSGSRGQVQEERHHGGHINQRDRVIRKLERTMVKTSTRFFASVRGRCRGDRTVNCSKW